MISKYSEEIKKGDFVIFFYQNRANLGFYLGKGSGMSEQYYSVQRLFHFSKYIEDYPEKVGSKPYKDYCASCWDYRIAKYSPELLNEEWREKYEIALRLFNSFKA